MLRPPIDLRYDEKDVTELFSAYCRKLGFLWTSYTVIEGNKIASLVTDTTLESRTIRTIIVDIEWLINLEVNGRLL